MQISNQLKKARKNKKLTQEYVASQINVSRKTISSWENGRGQPNSSYLKQLNSIYNTNLQFHYTQNKHENNNKCFNIIYFINLILFIFGMINLLNGFFKGIAILQFLFILFFCITCKLNLVTDLIYNNKNILLFFLLLIFLFIINMNNLEIKYTMPNILIDISFYIGAIIHSLILTASFFIITNYRKGK